MGWWSDHFGKNKDKNKDKNKGSSSKPSSNSNSNSNSSSSSNGKPQWQIEAEKQAKKDAEKAAAKKKAAEEAAKKKAAEEAAKKKAAEEAAKKKAAEEAAKKKAAEEAARKKAAEEAARKKAAEEAAAKKPASNNNSNSTSKTDARTPSSTPSGSGTNNTTNNTNSNTTNNNNNTNNGGSGLDLGLHFGGLPGIGGGTPNITDPDWKFDATDLNNDGINDSFQGGGDKVLEDMEHKYDPPAPAPQYPDLGGIKDGELVEPELPDSLKPDYSDSVPKAPDDTPGKAEYEDAKNQEAKEDGKPLPYPEREENNNTPYPSPSTPSPSTPTPPVEEKPKGPKVERNDEDGSTVKTYDDGTVVKEYDDGKVVTATKGGTVTIKNPDGTESSYVTSRPFEDEADWNPWQKVDSDEFAKKFMWAEQARYNIKDSEVFYDKNSGKYVVRDDKGNTYLVSGEGNDSKWEQTTSWTEDANGNDTFLTNAKDNLRAPGDFLIEMEKLNRKTEDMTFDEKVEFMKDFWAEKFSDPNSKLNLALGGADEKGLTKSGAVADRDGDGVISKKERMANVIDNLLSKGNDKTVGMLSKGLDAILQIAGIDDDRRKDIVNGAQTTLEVIDAVGSLIWNPITAPIHIMALASDASKDPKVIAANKKHEDLEESLYGDTSNTQTNNTTTTVTTPAPVEDPVKETAKETYDRLMKEKADADKMAVETIRRHEAEEMKNTSVAEKQDKLKEIELANIQKKRQVEAMNKSAKEEEDKVESAIEKLNEPTTSSSGAKLPGLKYYVEGKLGFSLPF